MGLRSRTISFDKLYTNAIPKEDVICFKDFSFAYEKKKNLEIPALSIPCGSVVAVIGKNGAGKSTFGRCMCGLEKRASGTMTFNECILSRKDRIKTCYLVMQDVNHQLFTESVLDEILLSMEKSNETEKSKRKSCPDSNLTQFGTISMLIQCHFLVDKNKESLFHVHLHQISRF